MFRSLKLFYSQLVSKALGPCASNFLLLKERVSSWILQKHRNRVQAAKIIRHFAGIVTPDFSTFADFPDPIKRYNTYRMRAFGCWMNALNIPVINNVRWGTFETWSYCFAGIPIGGAKLSGYTLSTHSKVTKPSESDIIASRVKGLDLREHPSKYKQLSSKKITALREKKQARTMTKQEYKTYESNKRLSARREEGVKSFWRQERQRIKNGTQTSRNWTPQQMHDILHRKKPKENGKSLHAHHAYSASRFPHLANRGEVLFPATFKEPLYGWHGGNFKKSLPGTPINSTKLH